ncbi:MAG: formate dehydrogenase accessory sulfurtransferase FdhD [Clostridia bacterium]|nr:formate dehydrogenase accessory sulfurtransferase FdhD [Clostridia bacterium]
MDIIKKVEIRRIKNDEVQYIEDFIVAEYPLTIFLNEIEIITLLATPKSLKELSVGFLISEGFIDNMDEIENIKFYEDKGLMYINTINDKDLRLKLKGKRTITSGCGKGTSFYNVLDTFKEYKIDDNFQISKDAIISIAKDFNGISETFQLTGGVHCVGICSKENIIWYEDDIGRHNALDKILGKCHIEGIDFKDKFIITTGRISSEILIKAAKRGISLVVSRSAPTEMSVALSKELGICLVGFVRGDKMNIYSNFSKVLL